MTLELQLVRAFVENHPREAALALERMPAAEGAAIFRAAPAEAGGALAAMVPAAAAERVALLNPDQGAAALDALPTEAAISLLRRMRVETAERFLAALPDAKREPLRRVLRYADDTAGAVMDPLVVAVPEDIRVGEARVRLRQETAGLLYYVYVVDRDGVLTGVLDIPELMLARTRERIGSVMNSPVMHVPSWAPAAAIRTHPGWRSFHALPVTDENQRFAGAIRYQTLRRLEAEADRAGGAAPLGVTVGALGELFHLGLAGMVEGVAGAASATDAAARGPEKGGRR